MDAANLITVLPAFALVLFRISGLALGAPVFSSSAIPARVKIGLVFLISLVIFPLVRSTMTEVPTTLLATAIAAAAELLIGLTIGMMVNLLFAGLELAGQSIDQQMGLGLARVFNPALETDTSAVSQFYIIVGMLVLLALNGHHLVISGVLDSFKAVPPMSITLHPQLLEVFRGLLEGSFVLALKVSAPTVAVLFLVGVVMGFLGRTVPQINILVVGFPLRITVGLVVMIGTMGVTLAIFSDSYRDTVDAVSLMIRHMGR